MGIQPGHQIANLTGTTDVLVLDAPADDRVRMAVTTTFYNADSSEATCKMWAQVGYLPLPIYSTTLAAGASSCFQALLSTYTDISLYADLTASGDVVVTSHYIDDIKSESS